MSVILNFFKCLPGRTFTKSRYAFPWITQLRNLTDTPDSSTKQVMVQGTENSELVRVRRARATDVPRILRFVREHARTVWPGVGTPPSEPHLILSDYVARALAQGHSMLAEQQEPRRGWNAIRGLALNTAQSPWDALMLERWARCVRCARSRQMMNFTAHCLRAPALHDKYHVHNILQVILIIPLDDTPKTTEIINMLAKNAIERGREMGFPLIRFDVSNSSIASTLEKLELKKEWQSSFDTPVREGQKAIDTISNTNDAGSSDTKENKEDIKQRAPDHFIAVYTSNLQPEKQ